MPPRPSKPKSNSFPAPAATPAHVTPVAPMAPAIVRSEIKGSGSRPATPAIGRTITRDMVAKRAYEIYANRGYAAGDQNADWLEAERQLKAGL